MLTILPIIVIGRFAFGKYKEKKLEEQKIEESKKKDIERSKTIKSFFHDNFGLFKTKTDKEEFDKEHKMIELEHKKLEKYAAEHDLFPVFKITKSNMPADEILEFAKKHDVDLIIMGIKKRTRYEKRHYPSTIDDVSKNFDRAILILN